MDSIIHQFHLQFIQDSTRFIHSIHFNRMLQLRFIKIHSLGIDDRLCWRAIFFLEGRTISPWSRWKTESSHIHCALFHLVLFIVRIVVFIFRLDKSASESDYRRVVPGLVCKLLAVFRSYHISREFPCNLPSRNLHSRNNTNANQDLLFLFQVSDKFVPTIETEFQDTLAISLLLSHSRSEIHEQMHMGYPALNCRMISSFVLFNIGKSILLSPDWFRLKNMGLCLWKCFEREFFFFLMCVKTRITSIKFVSEELKCTKWKKFYDTVFFTKVI